MSDLCIGWGKAVYAVGDFAGPPMKLRGTYRLSAAGRPSFEGNLGWRNRSGPFASKLDIAAFDVAALDLARFLHDFDGGQLVVHGVDLADESIRFDFTVRDVLSEFFICSAKTTPISGRIRIGFDAQEIVVAAERAEGSNRIFVELDPSEELALTKAIGVMEVVIAIAPSKG